MSSVRSMFQDLDESQKLQVRLGDDKQVEVEGKGTLVIKTAQGNTKHLDNVFFVPKLAHNLLSVGQLVASGYSILFDNATCKIKDKESCQIIADIQMTSNNMFPLRISSIGNHALIVKKMNESTLWHFRYGHLHINGLKLLNQKNMVIGLPKINDLENICEECLYGKQSRKSFLIGRTCRATHPLELVYSDLCGPMRIESLSGSRYFILFIDDYTRMNWVYFLKNKSEALEAFKIFKAFVERQSGYFIKVLRTDRGGEFLSHEFKAFCEENGIHRELTAPYTPEQNGVAERKNRTIVEMARSLLKAKGIPNQFWAESVATAVYLLNISPTKAILNRTLYEVWKGRKSRISHLKIFGCIAYVYVNSHDRHKLEDKSEKCIFIGYCPQSKAYRLYNPCSKKLIISRSVIFEENLSWNWNDDKMEFQRHNYVEGFISDSSSLTESENLNVLSPSSMLTGSSSSSPSTLFMTPSSNRNLMPYTSSSEEDS
ncbi:Retrovirus-related Pol polyprotein from transposon TNT 1-94 [Apostasia shenzhenica]|uniref:Retrovirus-related Pol polyprotein from transposon TNT 1-94 n=1 Tax=Apostasia shenzhenica TaxID=1088818 RepID=A0A2H9ZU53_9ASPA|nr:Retrovirus-related Pol polyprotein from transposon TNT 1-94 [Apostasia shenzhenica]